MRKIFLIILLSLLLFQVPNLKGQESKKQNIGQVWSCQTRTTLESKMETISLLSLPYNTDAKIINIFIHIIRRNDGTGGLTNEEVNNNITNLRDDYALHNIFIREIGREFINNTIFFDDINASNYNTLISTNSHSNAIDIYFLSPNEDYSRASGIPGNALAIGGFYSETSVLSHEFGHCLGLYHTHSGSGCYDDANCEEKINGSNCSTCGDLVCDTPADPCLSGKVNTNCEYIGGGSYNPDVENIMSYAPPECLNHLTIGQRERLHNIITNSPILQALSYAPIITGSSVICYSNSSFFNLTNIPSIQSYFWTSSSNLSYVSGQATNNYIVKAISPFTSSTGWIEAEIQPSGCNSVTIRKNVWVGKPAQPTINPSGYPTIELNISQYITIRVISTPGYPTSFNWWVTGNPCGVDIFPASNGKSCTFEAIEPSWNNFYFNTTNVCGTSTNAGGVIKVIVGGGGGMQSVLNLYPNPASSYITVSISDSIYSLQFTNEYELEVIDNYSNILIKEKGTEKEKQVNVSRLKVGVYTIRLKYNNKIYLEKFLIQ
jgi:hypothetical protein